MKSRIRVENGDSNAVKKMKQMTQINTAVLMTPVNIAKQANLFKEVLQNLIEKGNEKEDLYYALNVGVDFITETIERYESRGRAEKIPFEFIEYLAMFTDYVEKSKKMENPGVMMSYKFIMDYKGKEGEDVDNIKYKAEYGYLMCQLKEAAEEGDEGKINDTKNKIVEMLKNDDKHLLDKERMSQFRDYDLLKTYFHESMADEVTMKKILESKNVELLAYTILPQNLIENSGQGREHTEGGESNNNGKYIDELSAMKRLEYLVNNFNVSNVLIGKENSKNDSKSFYGSILFEMADSDVVIIEDFYRGKEGEEKESYAKATYILGKNEALNVVKAAVGRSKLKSENKGNTTFRSVNHKGEGYYNRLSKRYEEVKFALEHPELAKAQIEEEQRNIEGSDTIDNNDLENNREVFESINNNETYIEEPEVEITSEEVKEINSADDEKLRLVAETMANVYRIAYNNASIEDVDKMLSIVRNKIMPDNSEVRNSEQENKNAPEDR